MKFKKPEHLDRPCPELKPVRRVLLDRLQNLALFFGILPLVAALIMAIHIKNWAMFITDIAVYLLLVFFIRRPKKTYKKQALTIIVFIFVSGAILLFTLGMELEAQIWLFLSLFLSGLLLEQKGTKVMFFLTAVLFALIGVLLSLDLLPWDFSSITWAVISFNFFTVSLFLVYATRFIIYRLSKALRKEKTLNKNLRATVKENQHLIQEIHHRIKNNLQMMLSLLRLEHVAGGQKRDNTSLIIMENRFSALSLSYSFLDRDNGTLRVRMDNLLKTLLHTIFENRFWVESVAYETRIEPFFFSLEDAVPFCLMVSELLSKCLCHITSFKTTGEPHRMYLSFMKNKGNISFKIVVETGNEFDSLRAFDNSGHSSSEDIWWQIIDALADQIEAKVSLHPAENCFAVIDLPFSITEKIKEKVEIL